ncbi:MAG: 30S ribosomal protein S16 [Candidatus Peribacteraceae bacterium]|nr:30S ribosomal protein S16 [Candidatus Peribacteraceae bacterium]
MLRIRLQRTGNKNNPTYRMVVSEKTNAAKGKYMEIIGHYLPTRNPAVFEFNEERITHWIKNGAVPSDTVARLLSNSGVKGLEKYTERYTKQKKKKEVEEESPVAAPPASEEKKDDKDDKEEKDTAAPAEEEKKEEEAPKDEVKEEVKEEEKKEEAPKEEASVEEEAPKEEVKEDDKKEGDA